MTRGFTLVEMLVSVALLLVIAGLGYAFSFQYLMSQQLHDAAYVVQEELRIAALDAFAQAADAAHGVKVMDGQAVRFVGPSYAERIVSSDKAVPFPSSVTVSGDDEIVFPSGSMAPDAVSTVTLSREDRSVDLNVNAYGVVTLVKN